MDNWEKFNEMSIPEKQDFYRHLNIQDITDAGDAHAKRVCKDFKIINLGDYHDLYVKSDTLLLADVFENFWNMRLKIYELDPDHFRSTPGLAWQGTLKRQSKIRFFNWYWYHINSRKRYSRWNMSCWLTICES